MGNNVSPLRNFLNFSATSITEMGSMAVFSYGIARVFTVVNPAQAALFCVTTYATYKYSKQIFDKIFAGKNANDESVLLGRILHIAASLAVADYVSRAVFGAWAAWKIINPVHAAAFGATAVLVAMVVNKIVKELNIDLQKKDINLFIKIPTVVVVSSYALQYGFGISVPLLYGAFVVCAAVQAMHFAAQNAPKHITDISKFLTTNSEIEPVISTR